MAARIDEAIAALEKDRPGQFKDFRIQKSTIVGAGTGLFATKDYNAGDVVCNVPMDLILTGASAKSNGPWTSTEFGDAPYNYLLAGMIRGVAEAKKGTPGFGHFKFLPSIDELSHLPLFWTDEEIAQLHGMAGIASYRDAFRTQMKELADKMLPALRKYVPDASADDMLWAGSIVSSRTWSYAAGDCALVPVLDLLNHSPTAPAVTIAADGATYRAIRPIKAGEELFVNYGHKTAGEFLRGYGFIPDSGPNLVAVQLALNFNGEVTPFSRFLMEKLAITDRIATVPADRPSSALLRVVRIMNAEYAHLDRADDLVAGKMISPEHELRVVANAANVVRSVLAQYATTLDADKASLQALPPTASWKLRAALTLRVAEKTALVGQLRVLTLPAQ